MAVEDWLVRISCQYKHRQHGQRFAINVRSNQWQQDLCHQTKKTHTPNYYSHTSALQCRMPPSKH